MPDYGTVLALGAIRIYQRFVSPYKGFSCAYRCHTGCASCSALGFRAIRRFGVRRGVGILRQRFERCAIAHERYAPMARSRSLQAGYCDLSCDGCDGFAHEWCNVSPCDLPCGGDDKRAKKRRGDSSHVHIPPMKRTAFHPAAGVDAG